MKFSESEYWEELQTAFRAAEEAGELIDSFAENGFETESKDDGSRVTEADNRSQEKIVEVISEEFPEDGFLGEEQGLSPDGEGRVWVVDPVDGTYNFSKGFDHYCVSIALKKEGELVLGLVYSPESSQGKIYFAVKDEGAFVTRSSLDSAESISVSGQETVEDSLFFMSSFDLYEGQLEVELDILEKLARRGAYHRQLGSCALEMCYVAEGSVDFQLTPIVKEWDWAAAKLIIQEAGGTVRTREARFNGCTEVVCSNGLVQEELEEIIGDSFV